MLGSQKLSELSHESLFEQVAQSKLRVNIFVYIFLLFCIIIFIIVTSARLHVTFNGGSCGGIHNQTLRNFETVVIASNIEDWDSSETKKKNHGE